MAFDRKYPDTSKWSFILPFFGFEREKETSFYSQGVYVSDANALSGKSKVYRSNAYDEYVYVRTNAPTGRARDLEDKFIRIVSSSDKTFLAGIDTSLSDFYRHMLSSSKKFSSPPAFRWIFTIIAAILIGIWFLPYYFTFPIFVQRFGYEMGSALFVFPVPGTLFLIGWLIDKMRKRPYDRAYDRAYKEYQNEILNGYSKLSSVQKEEVRQQYFANMEKWYGKEAGAVLKEYAILKGYDRK